MPKKAFTIESTIPGYATARDNSNMVNMLRKAQTLAFWERDRQFYRLVTGDPTIRECQRGDSDAAQRRMDFIETITILPLTGEAESLAIEYQSLLKIPQNAYADCEHLAIGNYENSSII